MCIAECILDILGTTIDVDVVVEGVTCATIDEILPVVARNILVQVYILIVPKVVCIRGNLFWIIAILQKGKLILPFSVVVW